MTLANVLVGVVVLSASTGSVVQYRVAEHADCVYASIVAPTSVTAEMPWIWCALFALTSAPA